MRIAYHYGSLATGGVERRLGDLYRHLTRQGDDVWIVALKFVPGGRDILCRQGGVPEERILCAPPGTAFDKSFSAWSQATLEALEPDIIVAQWCATPMEYLSTVVATVHGEIPLPAPGLFDGILFVSESIVMPMEGQAGPIRAVENWVDLEEHPFHEDLPAEGACFLGREYKSENADMVACEYAGGTIDCYAEAWDGDHPSNMIYQGYGDPREVFPRYRVCFTAGFAARESLAAGRLTIAGQPNLFRRGDYRLVTPARIAEMSAGRFADMGPIDEVPAPTQAQRMEEFEKALGGGDWLEERKAMRAYLAEHRNAAKQIAKVRAFYEEVLQ